MRGVRALTVLGCSALAGLSPLDAAAWDGALDAGAQALAAASSLVRGGAGASMALRAAGVALLLLGAVLVFAGWLWRERALRRATPVAPEGDLDADWLERNVLSLPPELVGAVFDRRVAEPEVAAVLARMCGESKLASRVTGGARGWNNLELWLLVEPDELTGYERELVERLFGASKTTSADLIRERYRAVGFEPAASLRPALNAASDVQLGIPRASRWQLLAALGAASLGLVLAIPADVSGAMPLLLMAVVAALGPLLVHLVLAPRWRREPELTAARARSCLALGAGGVVALASLIAALPLPALGPLGVAVWGLLAAALVVRGGASRESVEGRALRRNLLAARRFFATELERPEPRLRDEWLPHLIALELNTEVARWYQAFGRIETASRRQRLQESTLAADTSASLWTGGAGALGGIGPSGPWIAAAARLTVVPNRERDVPGLALGRGLELERA